MTEPERGFSVMTHIRRRSPRMNVAHYQAIMTVKINTPKDIRLFDALSAAEHWIVKGNMRSDDKSRPPPKDDQEDGNENDAGSFPDFDP